MPILDQLIRQLNISHNDALQNITITEAGVGLYMAAVILSDGSAGVASAITDNNIHCSKEQRDYGEFTPLQITGRTLGQLLNTEKRSPLIQTLQIAAINAFAGKLAELQGHHIIENTDPVELLDLNQPLNITMVGAFQSAIAKIATSKSKLRVLELNQMALKPEHQQYYVPASEFAKVIPESDVVIITGLTLVNNTLDQLIAQCRPQSTVIVTGPSAGALPGVFFSNKISVIGATRISKPQLLIPLVCQGAAGYHLFKYCAEKICIVNPEGPFIHLKHHFIN